MDFKIVGSTEANSLEGKISNESPVGQALMGRKTGDLVEVETQAVQCNKPMKCRPLIYKGSEFAYKGRRENSVRTEK